MHTAHTHTEQHKWHIWLHAHPILLFFLENYSKEANWKGKYIVELQRQRSQPAANSRHFSILLFPFVKCVHISLLFSLSFFSRAIVCTTWRMRLQSRILRCSTLSSVAFATMFLLSFYVYYCFLQFSSPASRFSFALLFVLLSSYSL